MGSFIIEKIKNTIITYVGIGQVLLKINQRQYQTINFVFHMRTQMTLQDMSLKKYLTPGWLDVYLFIGGTGNLKNVYQDLLICPRNIGIEKSVEIMRDFDPEKAYCVYSKFKSKLEHGTFTRFSHEYFQDKILITAESMV